MALFITNMVLSFAAMGLLAIGSLALARSRTSFLLGCVYIVVFAVVTEATAAVVRSVRPPLPVRDAVLALEHGLLWSTLFYLGFKQRQPSYLDGLWFGAGAALEMVIAYELAVYLGRLLGKLLEKETTPDSVVVGWRIEHVAASATLTILALVGVIIVRTSLRLRSIFATFALAALEFAYQSYVDQTHWQRSEQLSRAAILCVVATLVAVLARRLAPAGGASLSVKRDDSPAWSALK